MTIWGFTVFLIGSICEMLPRPEYIVHGGKSVQGAYGYIKGNEQGNVDTQGEQGELFGFVFDVRCYGPPVKINVKNAATSSNVPTVI